jgi:hypothetical protein
MPAMRKLAQAAAAVLLVGLILWGVLLAIGLRQKNQAEALLQEITKLKPGESTFEDAHGLAARYGGKPWKAVPPYETCTAQECYLNFDFRNPRNHLLFAFVPLVQFGALVHVKDGRVTATEIWDQLESRSGLRAVYDVSDGLSDVSSDSRRYVVSPNYPGYGIEKLKVDAYGAPWIVEVRLDPRATAEERRRAYTFDLSCLVKIFGCRSRSSIIPRGLDDTSRTDSK